MIPAWPVASFTSVGAAVARATTLPAGSLSVNVPSFAISSAPKAVLIPSPSAPLTRVKLAIGRPASKLGEASGSSALAEAPAMNRFGANF